LSRIRGDTLISETNLASTTSADINLAELPRLSVQFNFTDATPSAKSFADTDVNIVTDRITITTHGFTTGLKGQFTTTGTLPGGISAATDYFIIRIDANTVQVGSSLANAEAGTAVLINSTGTGTHTFTPTALAGGSIQGLSSNDQVNFVQVADLVCEVDEDGTAIFNLSQPAYRYLRVRYTPSSGSVDLTAILNGYDGYEEGP
jgi:hypothetical protein